MTDPAKTPKAKVSWKAKWIFYTLLIVTTVIIVNTISCNKNKAYNDKIPYSIEVNEALGEVIPIDISANMSNMMVPPFTINKNELTIYYDWRLKSVAKHIKLPGEYFGYYRLYVIDEDQVDNPFMIYYFFLSKTPDNNYISVLKRPDREDSIGVYFEMEKIKDISIGDLNLIAVAKNDGIENFTYVCQNKSQTSVSFFDKSGILREKMNLQRPTALSKSFEHDNALDIYGFDGKDVFFYSIDKYSLTLKHKITLRDTYSKIFKISPSDRLVDVWNNLQLSIYDGEYLYLLDNKYLKKTYKFTDFKGCSIDRRFLYVDNKLFFSDIKDNIYSLKSNADQSYVKDGVLDTNKKFDQIFSSGYDLIHYCTGYWSEEGYIFSIYYYTTDSPKNVIYRHNFGPFSKKITSFSEDKRTLVLYSETLIYFYNKGPDWEDDLEIIPLNESALDK
ncbi:MAG TPA: hypothetical protein PK835_01250 [Caldisericia bacterium]|nr:hypothetical protein [Caldisericia bacterium]HQG59441.1 hypothetical protein [Caldisericia bacterium]HQH48974.1 hypothetical protein [Caldisericia bacterium]HQJ43799.1 hypothetical protein [Caldisericia bacterium]